MGQILLLILRLAELTPTESGLAQDIGIRMTRANLGVEFSCWTLARFSYDPWEQSSLGA